MIIKMLNQINVSQTSKVILEKGAVNGARMLMECLWQR